MRLWWLRHGPTHSRAMIGWTDLPADLSDTAALDRLDARLPQAPVVSSDLTRARDTAAALARGRPRLPADPGLREWHFGAWEGLTAGQIEARDGPAARRFWDEPGDIAPPGGESWHQVAARVGDAVARLADRAAAQGAADLILVAHFGVILTQIARARGCTPRAALAQRIEPLSLTLIDTSGPWRLERVNEPP